MSVRKQMAASLTVGDKTSWYGPCTAIEAANAADGEKTITLYQDVNGYADGHSTTYELTRAGDAGDRRENGHESITHRQGHFLNVTGRTETSMYGDAKTRN